MSCFLRKKSTLILFSLFLSLFHSFLPYFNILEAADLSADVCVVGGGSAGIAAAVAAAREGASVILVERYSQLGGTGTNALVSNWEGGPGCSLAKELYERMKALGGAGVARETSVEMDIPHGFKIIDPSEPYENSLVRAKPPAGGYRSVPYLPEVFDRVAREMLTETKRVTLLDRTEFLEAETNSEKNRIEKIQARNSESGETLTIAAKIFIDSTGSVVLCRQLGCETMLGIDPQSLFQEPSAPLKGGVQLNAITLCYRVEPRENPRKEVVAAEERTPFPKAAYITGWKDGPRMINMCGMLDGQFWISEGPEACLKLGEKIVRNHWAFMQQFQTFHSYELTEIAPMMGIREDYRTKTRYVLREKDIFGGWDSHTHPDLIAVADHPADVHGSEGGLRPVSTGYGIPYRCLIPEAPYTNLLVACRGAGFSHIAASSCRLQRTMIQLGHAAGVAAAWAARKDICVEEIDVPQLVEKMDAYSRYPAW